MHETVNFSIHSQTEQAVLATVPLKHLYNLEKIMTQSLAH